MICLSVVSFSGIVSELCFCMIRCYLIPVKFGLEELTTVV